MNAQAALKQVAKNTAARWCYGDGAKDADPSLALNRIHRGYFTPTFRPKFQLKPDAKFFALGSCFAREIETALLRRHVTVGSRILELQDHADFPKRDGTTTIYDLFNRYNVPSIVRELKSLSKSSSFALEDRLIYEQADGLFDDLHYTGAVQSAPMAQVLKRRRWMQERLATGYIESDVVVITLGLSEAWFDVEAQDYLNVVSSPQMLRRYSDRLNIQMISYSENMSYLQEAVDILKADGKRGILTVSPVPLQVTFLGSDIVIANTAAKSILRALCQEASSLNDHVDYFPSYEMVTYSQHDFAWKSDGRHVQMPMVEKIMTTALDAYIQKSAAGE